MKLIPISEHPDAAKILYQLLEEREAHVNISHKRMPTWEEHLLHLGRFSPRSPDFYCHLDWCLILDQGPRDRSHQPTWFPVGAIYLSYMNELGPGILKDFQREGYGEAACRAMMEKHGPRRYLWNVNPQNAASMALARKLGFELLQYTFARDTFEGWVFTTEKLAPAEVLKRLPKS